MRIEAYSQVQQMYQTKKVKKNSQAGSTSQSDQVQISSLGKDFQAVKAAVTGAPDIREDLVAPIRTRVQNGTYQVDNGTFAEKLLQKYEEMR